MSTQTYPRFSLNYLNFVTCFAITYNRSNKTRAMYLLGFVGSLRSRDSNRNLFV